MENEVPGYSMVSMATTDHENIYTEAIAINNSSKKDVLKNKKPYFAAILIIAVVLALVISGCFVALFIEIANLKSEMSYLQQTSEQMSTVVQRMKVSFDDILMLHDDKIQLLDDSFDGLESISNLQDTKMQDLNSSVQQIRMSLQNITNLQNSMIQELNISVDETFASFENRLRELAGAGNSHTNTIQQLNVSLVEVNSQLTNFSGHLFQLNTSLNEAVECIFPSCTDLPPSSPAGYYLVGNSRCTAVQTYRSCGGVTGSWRRVAELDMTNSSHQCPSGFRQRNDASRRTCVRTSSSNGCTSINFSGARLQYSSVCGKIIAYQYGAPEAFREGGNNIDSYYVV
jgi:uncharacterized coiled-coil protein SlyX